MFQETTITTLVNRLGWGETEAPEFFGKLKDINKTSASGLVLQNYHSMVTIENFYFNHPQKDIADTLLNNALLQLRDNVVREILTDVFVLDSRADSTKDYSVEVDSLAPTGFFDNAIGYCHAVKFIEKILHSVRSNRNETINKNNFQTLKQELQGYYNNDGTLVMRGLVHKCAAARSAIKEKFYLDTGTVDPDEVVINDITDKW